MLAQIGAFLGGFFTGALCGGVCGIIAFYQWKYLPDVNALYEKLEKAKIFIKETKEMQQQINAKQE